MFQRAEKTFKLFKEPTLIPFDRVDVDRLVNVPALLTFVRIYVSQKFFSGVVFQILDNVSQLQLLVTGIFATDFVLFTTLNFGQCCCFLFRTPFPGS